MADYHAKIRTNCFAVTDEMKFRNIISSCSANDEIIIFDEKQDDGSKKYGFYCFGSIYGLPETEDNDTAVNSEESSEYEDCDYSYDLFTQALQEIIPDDEAVIIIEIGNEKMRYLVGRCTVITRNDVKYGDIVSVAEKLAQEMLGNSSYETEMYG